MSKDLVEALNELGLTEYEAKCLVALVGVEQATASEVSDLARMPRSRVYDTAEQLQRRGFIEVREDDTTRYRSVAVERIVDSLQSRYRTLVDEVDEQLSELEVRSGGPRDGDGVWTITGRESVLERAQSLVEESSSEVFLVAAHDDLLDEACYDCLQRALGRGVDVRFVSPDESVRESVRERLPGATVVDSAADWVQLPHDGSYPGRVLMVDREHVLIATVGRENPLGGSTWTAVLGSGSDNGFVVVLRGMLAWHVDTVFGDA